MASEDREEEEKDLWVCICGDGEAVTFDVSKIEEYSGYFSAMLHSEMRETIDRQISLDLISSETLIRLLKLFNVHEDPIKTEVEALEMFGGDLSLDNIEEFLSAVDYLDVRCLYPRCCDILVMLMPSMCTCLSMVWRLWENCQYFGLEAVKTEMYTYLAKQMSRFSSMDFFFIRELPLELLAGMLSMPDIDIASELDVMKLIKDWVLYCPEVRSKDLGKLMKSIHIPSMLHCELNEIESMLEELDAKDHSIVKTYSDYLSNPHKYLASRNGQVEIRNGQEVVILFSGVYESRLNPGNLQTGRGRQRSTGSLPLLYQTLDVVRQQCMSAGVPQNKTDPPPAQKCVKSSKKGKSPSKHKSPVFSPGSSVSENGLCPKPMTKIKAPGVLMEFGLCVHENFVYLAGGQYKPQADAYPLKGVYRFDCHLGEWVDVSSMREQRCLFFMCSIWGRMYAVGGANFDGILRQVEYYEPSEDRWCEGPILPHDVHEHAGCAYNDKIYICGGHNDTEHTDAMLVLDGPDSKWRPLAPMLQPRSYHTLTAVGSHMYVFGGCCQTGEEMKDLYRVDQYSPQSDTWTRIMNLNVPINESLPILIDDEVLFVGSYSFVMKEYLHQTVSVNLRSHKWKVVPLEFSVGKKMVGYKCLKLKIKNRLVK